MARGGGEKGSAQFPGSVLAIRARRLTLRAISSGEGILAFTLALGSLPGGAYVSVISPVAMRQPMIAASTVLAGRHWPEGPCGILPPLFVIRYGPVAYHEQRCTRQPGRGPAGRTGRDLEAIPSRSRTPQTVYPSLAKGVY